MSTLRTRTLTALATVTAVAFAPAAGAVEQTAVEETAVEEAAVEAVDLPAEQRPDEVVDEQPVTVPGPTDPVVAEGDTRRIAAQAGPLVMAGRGNGHGIGMSQYGARGQALAGRSTTNILQHYYAGSSLSTSRVDFDPRIGVRLDQTAVWLVVRGGAGTVTIDGTTRSSRAGDIWQVRLLASVEHCLVIGPDGTEYKHHVDRGICATVDPADGARVDVYTRGGDGVYRSYAQYGRGAVVEAIPDQVGSLWRIDVVVEIPLEHYLYGLAEMPYSWDDAALRSQAIAGRSYALYRLKQLGNSQAALEARGCSCHLYDSQQDQVYDGWEREQSAGWSNWKRAVDSTSGLVVKAPGQIGTLDGVVQAFYSSSSNGRTESKHELWGGSVYPYLLSVDDRWAMDPATGNPHRSWEKDLSRATLASRLGLDRVDEAWITAYSSSGATTRVRFDGVDDGRARSVSTTGSWVRSNFGLRSTTFHEAGRIDFVDIAGSPHAADIRWIAAQGITSGCNQARTAYCPDASVTRGQMAAFINRAFDLPPGSKVFADTRGHAFQADIAALARAGITSGCSQARNQFCPDDDVTRAEMAAFLRRAADWWLGGRTTFVDSRGHLHEESIERMRRNGVTQGCNPPQNTRYCPEDDITRAQMATFLRRVLDR